MSSLVSERQMNRQKLLPNRVTSKKAIILAVFIFIMSACGTSVKNTAMTTEDALASYSDFLHEIERKKYADMNDIISLSQQWHTSGDSVRACIARDSIGHSEAAFNMLNDSIQYHMDRLIDSRPRNFGDYLSAIECLSELEVDTASANIVKSVQAFYQKADSLPVYRTGKARTIAMYEKILEKYIALGFKKKKTVLQFLQDEDVAFRSFLEHLPALGNVPLDGIKWKSEAATKSMAELVNDKHPSFTKSELVILLTMRNNRRLILNAVKCIKDINTTALEKGNQSNAYLWMLLQPWVIMDDFSYALLTPQQLADLKKLADETPLAMKKLKETHFPVDTDRLPALLIKSYVSYPQ